MTETDTRRACPFFPLVTAHAGSDGTAPNSIPSARSAVEASADFVEVDLRGTAAGLNLDVKDDRCIPGLVRGLKRCGMTDRAVITGCRRDRATRFKADYPFLQVLLNVDPFQGRVRRGGRSTSRYRIWYQGQITAAVQRGCCGLNMEYRWCTEELVVEARRRFVPVSVWTVDSEEDLCAFAAIGVSNLTTNQVRRALRLKAASGRPSERR